MKPTEGVMLDEFWLSHAVWGRQCVPLFAPSRAAVAAMTVEATAALAAVGLHLKVSGMTFTFSGAGARPRPLRVRSTRCRRSCGRSSRFATGC